MRIPALVSVFAGLVLSIASSTASASPVVYDFSPAATHGAVGGDSWSNYSAGQNFADTVKLSASTLINGMDIYMGSGAAHVGDAVKVTIWNNGAGQPGSVAAVFNTLVSAVDSVGITGNENRVHADLTGFTMLDDTTYWIGMTPTSAYYMQTSLRNVAGGDNQTAQFSGSNFSYFTGIGDMAFRLEGGATVPEPASVALFGIALLGFGAARRRKQ